MLAIMIALYSFSYSKNGVLAVRVCRLGGCHSYLLVKECVSCFLVLFEAGRDAASWSFQEIAPFPIL